MAKTKTKARAAKAKARKEPIAAAQQLRRDGRIFDGIALLYDALGRDFGNDAIIAVLATMLAETEQFDRAQRLFDRAMREPDPSITLRLNYATFLCHSGRPQEAFPVFGAAMAEARLDVEQSIDCDDSYSAAAALTMLGACQLNFARALMIVCDTGAAGALARAWLTHEHVGDGAASLLADIGEWEGDDDDEDDEDDDDDDDGDDDQGAADASNDDICRGDQTQQDLPF